MSESVFWDRLAKVNAGMLAAGESPRFTPMSHNADRDARRLWFITAQGTDLVEATGAGPVAAVYMLADGGKGLYAQVNGTLELSTDRAKLDEIWNMVASSWFDGGKQDPDLRLLSLSVTGAEVWATTTSGVAFMYQIAKAQLTGSEPDMGEHFTL